MAALSDLSEEEMVRVLYEPKDAIIKQYTKLFELDNANLVFTDEAIGAIAREAIKNKTGARGLRSIIESILLETMYSIPNSKDDLRTVIIDEATIKHKHNPQIKIEKHRGVSKKNERNKAE